MKKYITKIDQESVRLKISGNRFRVFRKGEETLECTYTEFYPQYFELIGEMVNNTYLSTPHFVPRVKSKEELKEEKRIRKEQKAAKKELKRIRDEEKLKKLELKIQKKKEALAAAGINELSKEIESLDTVVPVLETNEEVIDEKVYALTNKEEFNEADVKIEVE